MQTQGEKKVSDSAPLNSIPLFKKVAPMCNFPAGTIVQRHIYFLQMHFSINILWTNEAPSLFTSRQLPPTTESCFSVSGLSMVFLLLVISANGVFLCRC